MKNNIKREILERQVYSPGSIPRAAKILACLGGNINSITEIAQESRFAKSTVHRILKLMEESALVRENPVDRRYYVGPLITSLATNPTTTHEYFIRCAIEHMKRLSNLSGETVALDILYSSQIVPLYEIPGLHDFKVVDKNHKLGPLCVGASAKVLLSQLSDERLKIAMKYINIPQQTDQTITNKNTLLVQIAEIRKNGYAVSHGERYPGVMCISIPIHNYTSPAVLSVVGLESRMIAHQDLLIRELKSTSLTLSQRVREIYAR